jgi:hypothetical protein
MRRLTGDEPEVVGSSMACPNDLAQSPSLGAYLEIAGELHAHLAALREIVRSSSSHESKIQRACLTAKPFFHFR